ncbi:MAG: hypothetical protein QOD77_58 [Thermoplasmata archaeon]|jgi:hypothetical protein|nr:hypothetical protein [Thermoplasmata archaeon]
MQRLALLAILIVVAGCASPDPPQPPAPEVACEDQPPRDLTLYLGPGRTLVPELPAESGVERSDGFEEGFANNGAVPWRSEPVEMAVRVVGDVRLELFARSTGSAGYPTPAAPGEAFRFFNQFGSSRFPGAATAAYYTALVEPEGTAWVANQTFVLPKGGIVLERNDTASLLLAGLSPDGEDILFGGDTPSRLTFQVACEPDHAWVLLRYLRFPVNLPANQGGPTGAIPAIEGVNLLTVPFTLENGTQRLRVFLRGAFADSEPKDDLDLRLLDAAGNVLVDPSTPYTDELLVLWPDNLAAFMPLGDYTIRVDSYSGVQYSGLLEIALEAIDVAAP